MSLPILDKTQVRPSRTGKWRATALVTIHLFMLIHVVQWWITGKTISPIEPSEAMYTLNNGTLNAGCLFFTAAILATLLLGRFVCGWGCHFIAYQDLCAWALKKIGIKPKAFRSRILPLAPLTLALYMFVWPTVYRWCVGIKRPLTTNHLLTTAFWATFPGPAVAVLTVLVAGVAIVYFLGSKGFCTYACPYGGFFGLAEQLAPGRILVTDGCEQCGHCTATCTSNVKVHEEVALYGMVVDPGCMKCMDCVSVCPNDALYFGFAKPALGAKPRSPRKPVSYDFSFGEELLMALTGLAALLALRGLYDQIPLLLAMGLAAMTGFVAVKLVALARRANVRWQNLQLKRGGTWTRAGVAFAVATTAWLSFTLHSAAVRYHVWRGETLFDSLALGDEIWLPGKSWSQNASEESRALLHAAVTHLKWTDRWGMLPMLTVLRDLTWLYLADDRLEEAERTIRRMIELTPTRPEPYRSLACVQQKAQHPAKAEEPYRKAIALDPAYAIARDELGAMLMSQGRVDEVITLYRDALARDPNQAGTQYNLGMAYLARRDIDVAVEHLKQAAAMNPAVAMYQYNFAVATFMTGHPTEALPIIREAVRLAPDDPDSHGFLAVVLEQLGDMPGAQAASEQAMRLGLRR